MRKLRNREVSHIPKVTQLVSGPTRVMNPSSLVLELVLLTCELTCLKLALACWGHRIIVIIIFLAYTT